MARSDCPKCSKSVAVLVDGSLARHMSSPGARCVPDVVKPVAVPAKDATGKRTAIPAAMERWVLNRDGNQCKKCGHRGGSLDLHHIVEVCEGGQHDPDNLDALCGRCHREVTDGLPPNLSYAEWLDVPPGWMFVVAFAESRKDTNAGRKLREELRGMTADQYFDLIGGIHIGRTGRWKDAIR